MGPASLLLAGWLLGACTQPELDVDLLEVDSFSVSESEHGLEIEFAGEGFSGGQVGQLIAEGTLYRPGVPPEVCSLRAPANATSETLVRAVLDDATLTDAGRATFRGSARLVFDAYAGQGTVSGLFSDLELDLHPHGALGADALDNAHAALARWGIEPAEEPADEGLVVAVSTGSAARAGLRQGDRISSFRGVRVLALEDVRDAGEDRVDVTFQRASSASLLSVQLSHESASTAPVVPWHGLALGLFLLFVAALPARALGGWALALRHAWKARRQHMLAQTALAAGLGALLWQAPRAAVGVLLSVALLRVLISRQPARLTIRLLPGVVALVAVDLLMPSRSSELLGTHPWMWLPALVALCSLMDGPAAEGTRQAWLATVCRASGAAAVATVFMPGSLLLTLSAAGLASAASPEHPGTWRRAWLSFLSLGVLAAPTQALPTATLSDGVWLPAALAVSVLFAFVATRQRPIRVPIGL